MYCFASVYPLLEVLRVDVRIASRRVVEGFDRQDRVGVVNAAVVLVEHVAGLGARRVGVGLACREAQDLAETLQNESFRYGRG